MLFKCNTSAASHCAWNEIQTSNYSLGDLTVFLSLTSFISHSPCSLLQPSPSFSSFNTQSVSGLEVFAHAVPSSWDTLSPDLRLVLIESSSPHRGFSWSWWLVYVRVLCFTFSFRSFIMKCKYLSAPLIVVLKVRTMSVLFSSSVSSFLLLFGLFKHLKIICHFLFF